MKNILLTAIAVVAFICPSVQAGVIYQEDFEGLATGDTLPSPPWSWLVQGYDASKVFVWGYYPGGAPNVGIYEVETGQAGAEQGLNTLRSNADYGADYPNNPWIETVLFNEHTITAGEAALGTATFAFDYKNIGVAGTTTEDVFLKVLDPNNSFATMDIDLQAVTAADTAWGDGFLSVDVSAATGMILQFGTSTFVENYGASGIGLDNIDVQAVPEPATAGLLAIAGISMYAIRRIRRFNKIT